MVSAKKSFASCRWNLPSKRRSFWASASRGALVDPESQTTEQIKSIWNPQKLITMNQPILEIRNLSAGVDDKQILKGIDLTINAGETHAVMGPNGSGKSTLAAVLAGREGYEITSGEVLYQGHDLLDMAPEERAREGLFLA